MKTFGGLRLDLSHHEALILTVVVCNLKSREGDDQMSELFTKHDIVKKIPRVLPEGWRGLAIGYRGSDSNLPEEYQYAWRSLNERGIFIKDCTPHPRTFEYFDADNEFFVLTTYGKAIVYHWFGEMNSD